jgi:hypothetical protein
MRAATLTPVGSAGAYLARLPVDGGLPRSAGGSAPTSDTFEAFSVFAHAAARMARWPPTGAVSRSASDHSSPPDPLRVLPAGARVAGWDLHPRNQCTFARHTAERGRAPGLAHRRARARGLGPDQGPRARAAPALGLEGRAARGCRDYLIPNRAIASSPDTCLPPGYSC